MSKENGDGNDGAFDIISSNQIASKISKFTTRREFLKMAGIGGVGTLTLYAIGCAPKAVETASGEPSGNRDIYVADAQGMVIGNPARCVGCRRCELACTEYNEGKSHPSIARINVRRNWGFGTQGVQLGYWRGEGRFGNHRVIQDTCRQCAHPVPCQLACPYDAIEVNPPTNARVINQDKCHGCRTCQRACPWGMTTFDEEIKKATKCHLCNGKPECVRACPSGALQYIPWEDRTKELPSRFVVPAYIETSKDVAESCEVCHD
ncbi:4Fe-4S dicluster domain-containing protein [Chloroflexota bacterium]